MSSSEEDDIKTQLKQTQLDLEAARETILNQHTLLLKMRLIEQKISNDPPVVSKKATTTVATQTMRSMEPKKLAGDWPTMKRLQEFLSNDSTNGIKTTNCGIKTKKNLFCSLSKPLRSKSLKQRTPLGKLDSSTNVLRSYWKEENRKNKTPKQARDCSPKTKPLRSSSPRDNKISNNLPETLRRRIAIFEEQSKLKKIKQTDPSIQIKTFTEFTPNQTVDYFEEDITQSDHPKRETEPEEEEEEYNSDDEDEIVLCNIRDAFRASRSKTR